MLLNVGSLKSQLT